MEIRFSQDNTDKALSLTYTEDNAFFLEVIDNSDDTGINMPLDLDELELIRNCIDHILKKDRNNG